MGEIEEKDTGEFSNFWLSAFLVLNILVLASTPLLGAYSDAGRIEYLRTTNSTPVATAHSDLEHAQNDDVDLPLEDDIAASEDVAYLFEDAAGEMVAKSSNPSADGSATETRNPEPGLDGLAFDLSTMSGEARAQASTRDGLIEVRKPVFADGVRLGDLTIRIDKSSDLHAAPEELEPILAQSGALSQLDRFASVDFVSFKRLRQSGIDLRYDPISDRIILNS